MELKDRIANIKTILPYCSGRSDEVKIVVDEVGEFFANLIKRDSRFEGTKYEKIYPRVFLHKFLNTDYKTYSTSIGIEYSYDGNREGDYISQFHFNDEDLEDSNFGKVNAKMEYSEIPDNIWSIIQDKLYENARKTVADDLASATKEVDRCTNKFLEFNKLELFK